MNSNKSPHTVIIGKGLLGSELYKNLVSKDIQVQNISSIEYDDLVIPEKTECIIFVAQSKDYRSETMTKDLLFVNSVLPSQVIIEAYKKGVKRIAFCSTGSVYTPSNKPHKEDEIIIPSISFYEASKKATELLLFPWKNYFERLTIYRPFFIYGPHQTDEKLIARIISSVKNNSTVKLGQGTGPIINPIHVCDAAEFIIKTTFNKKGFDIYNLAGNEIINLKEITEIISKILNKDPLVEITNDSINIILGSVDKINLENFVFTYDLKNGLTNTIFPS
jgi:nucleoside-diphosphate-sugar epimerase